MVAIDSSASIIDKKSNEEDRDHPNPIWPEMEKWAAVYIYYTATRLSPLPFFSFRTETSDPPLR
jgi:hypothetical protein